jgi:hypothetical protein
MDFHHNTFSSQGKIKHGLPQQSLVGPLLFLCYTHDWPKIKNNSKPILYEDDSSKIVTNPNAIHFTNYICTIFEHINIWVQVNLFIKL